MSTQEKPIDHRLEWKKQEYATSGKRAAGPYIEPGSRYVDVPLATFRERIQKWIENSPTEDETACRTAYQEAFEAELGANHE